MQTSTLGLYIVGFFLFINLLLGLWVGKDIKNIRDYALGNKNWSTGALVMTYMATAFSGSNLFRGVNGFFHYGLFAFAGTIGSIFATYIRYKFIANKMHKFQGCITLGDVFYQLYGKWAKVFVGLIGGVFCLMVVGMQIQILSLVFVNFFEFHENTALYTSALCISIYTAFGGIKSVVYTDLLQFIFLVAGLFFLSNISLSKAGGMQSIIHTIQFGSFTQLTSNNFSYILCLFFLEVIFSSEIIEPAHFQRVLMAKNTIQLKKLFVFSQLGWVVYACSMAIIALSVKSICPNIQENILIYAINNFLPSDIKIIVIVGLIAFIFSSGDSCLHSAGLSFYYDCLSPVFKKIKDHLFYLKSITFGLGIFACYLAFHKIAFLRLDYLLGVITSTICAPFLLGIIGYKATTKSFWISLLFGLFTFIISISGIFGVFFSDNATLIGSLTNAILYIFLYSKDLYFSKVQLPIESNKSENKTKFTIFTQILNFASVCRERVKLSNSPYSLFGIFYTIIILLPHFIEINSKIAFQKELIYLRFIALTFCALLISHSIWSKFCKKYLPAFWYITLIYCLPFLSTVMLIITHGAVEYTINIAINIMFLLLLVDWASAIGIAFVGISAAIAYYKYFLQIDSSETIFGFDTLYLLLYQVIFGSLIGLLFARKKHIKLQNIDTKADYLATLNYSILDTNQRAIRIIEDSNKSHLGTALNPQENINEIKNLLNSKSYGEISKQLDALETYVTTEAFTISPYFVLNVEQIEIATLTEKCAKFCKVLGCEDISINIFTKKQKIQCDPIATIKVLTKLISDYCKQAQTNDEEDDIYINISVTDTVLSYSSAKNGNFIRIQDAINFTISDSESINKEFSKGLFEKILTDPIKIPYTNFNDCEMLDIERTVDAHYGVLRKSEDVETFAWACVLPVKVYDIRPITLDLSAPTTQDLNYEWPAADELEKIFLEKIKKSIDQIDEKKLAHAIDVIKIYHRHQSRKSGEPYYMHPIDVAMIVIDLINDKDSTVYNLLQENQETVILTALLHDILEDTYYKPKNLIQDFGVEVLRYVESVTKANYEVRQYLLVNRVAFQTLIDKEPITIVVKLADRLHNIMTIDGHPSEQKRRAVAEETLDFFIAPAKKLGLTDMAQRLEDTSNYILRNGKLDGFRFQKKKI